MVFDFIHGLLYLGPLFDFVNPVWPTLTFSFGPSFARALSRY